MKSSVAQPLGFGMSVGMALFAIACSGDETPPVTAHVSGVPDEEQRTPGENPVDGGSESVDDVIPDELGQNECDEPIQASTEPGLPMLFAAPAERGAVGPIEIYWSFCNAGPGGTTTGAYQVNLQLYRSALDTAFEWQPVDGTLQTFDTVMPAVGQCECIVQSIAINGPSSPGLFNQENWVATGADYQPIEINLPIRNPDDITDVDSAAYEYQVWVSKDGVPTPGLERIGFQLQSGESENVACTSDASCLGGCCELGMNICNMAAFECGGGA